MEKFGRNFGLQWHVTNQCDQRCKHCYIWSGKEKEIQKSYNKELNLKQCIAVVDKFLRFCTSFKVDPFFSITGGDPLLFRWFWQILEYLYQKGIPFIVLGNPFHLNDNTCKRLRDLGCKGYQMSLDGLEKTHDIMRKRGSFGATFTGIKLLQNAGIKTMIMSTVSRLNYREISKLIRLAVDVGIDVYDFARYCPIHRDTDLILAPDEYRQFLSEIWDVYTELAHYHTRFPLKDHLWRLFLYEKGLFQIRKTNTVLQGCNCGIRHLTILPDGVVYACRRFESPVGNILTQSFKQIFLGQKLSRYREVEKFEGCKDCELLNYCRGCHAVSYGVFENYFAKDPQCWQRINKQIRGEVRLNGSSSSRIKKFQLLEQRS